MRGPCDARERAPILFFARTSLATIPTSPAILQASIDPSSGCRSIASKREAVLKKNGFEKLRLTACAGAMGLLAGVCGVSRSARAAVVPTGGSITLAGARWGEFRNSASTGPFATGGFAMTSGSLTGPARNDAFDGAMLCRVNGTTFANPGGTVDVSPVAGGQKVTSNTATIGSLQVQMTYYASSSNPVLRGICTVTNPTGSPIAVTLMMGSNLGSDSGTTIHNTSSGDAVVDSADRWFVSSDLSPATGDPVLLIGRFGTGASALPTLIQIPGGGNDNFIDQYTFTLAAGATSSIMQLAWLNTDVAPANANAPNFDSIATLQSAGLLSDLSAAELARIINYAAGAASAPTAVPTLSETGGLILAVMVGASALVHFARRRTAGDA